jgi:hypothetical protein
MMPEYRITKNKAILLKTFILIQLLFRNLIFNHICFKLFLFQRKGAIVTSGILVNKKSWQTPVHYGVLPARFYFF